jgi:hypothetical protein
MFKLFDREYSKVYCLGGREGVYHWTSGQLTGDQAGPVPAAGSNITEIRNRHLLQACQK